VAQATTGLDALQFTGELAPAQICSKLHSCRIMAL